MTHLLCYMENRLSSLQVSKINNIPEDNQLRSILYDIDLDTKNK